MDSNQGRVNITVVTSCRGPAKQEAVGWYLIEHIKGKEPETKDGYLYRESITGKTLTLQLLTNALFILSKSNVIYDTIEVHIEDKYIESAYLNNWMDTWKDSDWNNSRGKPVADQETWIQLYDLMDSMSKRFIVGDKRSSYSSIMHMWCDQKLSIEKRLRQFKEDNNHV